MKVVKVYLVQDNYPMGAYYSKIKDIDGESLFPDDIDARMVYTLELVDMDEEEFNRLKEFAGF